MENNLTVSEPQNIFTPPGNSLAVYISADGSLMLKDINGKIQLLSNYIVIPEGITVVLNYDLLPDATTVSGKFYWCQNPLGNKLTGIYYSNGIDWEYSQANEIIVVANYSALPNPTTVPYQFYWCSNSQGTSWLPGIIGGTYYGKGMYYSNGISWEFIDVPYQATQTEVNTGTNDNKFVTPLTFENATKWSTKQNNLNYPASDNKLYGVKNQIISEVVINDASETVSGIINTTTQSIAGNKTIKGESSLSGNALKLINSNNEEIISFGNNKTLTTTDKFILKLNRTTNNLSDSPRISFSGNNTRKNDIYADQEYINITGALRIIDTYNQGFIIKHVDFSTNEGTATSPNIRSSNGIRGGIYLTRFNQNGATYIGFSTSNNNETPLQRVVIDKFGALVIGGANVANTSSLLQVDSTVKGSIPFPRMTETQKLAISSPAIGLHVYQTDSTEGVYVYKSSGWAFAY